ncbi:MAG: hypothetical protein KDB27_04015 [Planctomycetales bacterium]|nr:hypothetical protein [Planctomycetales bacterium]
MAATTLRKCFILVLVVPCVVNVEATSATVISSTFDGSEDTYSKTRGIPVGSFSSAAVRVNNERAQSFIVPTGHTFRLDSIEVVLRQTLASSDDRLRFRLFTDDEGEPGEQLEEFMANGVGNEAVKHELASQVGTPLYPGEKYWVIASTPVPAEYRFNESILWMTSLLNEEADRWDRIEFEKGAVGAWDRPRTSVPLTLRVVGTTVVAGDYNENGVLDVGDLDLQAVAISSGLNEVAFDLNADGLVDISDRIRLVEGQDFLNTFLGDSTLDGEFSSADLVAVFQSAKYETGELASWSEGDWNGDMMFSSRDLVAAFQSSGYENGPRQSAVAVPEPTTLTAFTMALLVFRIRPTRLT